MSKNSFHTWEECVILETAMWQSVGVVRPSVDINITIINIGGNFTMANKWVYMFSEGDMTMRNLLGGKGANLAEMTNIGLPVPQGFTVTTEACTQYYEDGRQINDEIMAQIMDGVKKMEEINGKKFGDSENPLLVSVRSGARASMPGMMDTILNLGLNDDVVATMIKGNHDPTFERFEYDS